MPVKIGEDKRKARVDVKDKLEGLNVQALQNVLLSLDRGKFC
jgi:hypothetical protein